MEIVVFGLGRNWKYRKQYFNHPNCRDSVVGYIDNYVKKIDEIEASDISLLSRIKYDIVLIMCNAEGEIRKQLIEYGVDCDRIMTWEEYVENVEWMKCDRLIFGNLEVHTENSVAIVTTPLDYTGAAIAAINAGRALRNAGKNAVLICSMADSQLIEECIAEGIAISLCPNLNDLNDQELEWISKFEYVIVNTYPMYRAALKLAGLRSVLWWIHEASDSYFGRIDESIISSINEAIPYIHITPVSGLALRNFAEFTHSQPANRLFYGIPDFSTDNKQHKKNDNRLVFAIVGTICKRKAQDVFIEAFCHLNDYQDTQMEKWIIGCGGNDDYSKRICEIAKKDDSIRVFGEVGREKIQELYSEIDVLVCPSREDPLPIVCTEAFMNSKPVIVSDSTGTAEFIKDGENGFVVKADDAFDLADKIQWMIDHRDRLAEMGKKARSIYDAKFSMDVFEKELITALDVARMKYESGRENR